MEFAGIADRGFDEDDRDVTPEAMDAANFFFLLGNSVMAGPMRYEDRKFQMTKGVPEESGSVVDEVELFEAELGAAPRAGHDREDQDRQDEGAGDFDAVWF